MGSSTAPVPLRWVAGLPLPSRARAEGFGIEVAFDDAAGAFVALADDDRFARVLLARLVHAGRPQGHVALDLPRDSYRGKGGAPIGNRELQERRRRQLERLRRLGGRGAVPLVAASAPDSPLPPLAFDRGTGRLFPLVDPRTWRPLATCRDDARLRAARLQPWSNTTLRHLHDPAAADGDWYTWAPADGAPLDGPAAGGARVRHRHDLFRDLVAAFHALAPEARAALAAREPDLAAVLADLRAEQVEQRIVPLAFHDAIVWCTEASELQFDEYCDLVGGAPFAAAVPLATPARAATAGAAQARFAGVMQWLAAPWLAGDGAEALAADPRHVRRLAVEAAFLKLHAFVAACRAAAAWHQELDEPHLGLAGDGVQVRVFGSAGAPAPARWCVDVALATAGASLPLVLDGRGQRVAAGLCQPAHEGARAGHATELADAAAALEFATRVAATPLHEQGAVVGMRCELALGKERPRALAVGDVVRLQPDEPLGALGDRAWLVRVVAVQRQAVTAELRVDASEGAPLPDAPLAFAATATCHRRLRPANDLFSLGMLLARALLVHDERDLFAVRELWDRLLDRLDLMLAGQTAPDGARVAAAMRGLLDGERAALDSGSVLWPKALRAAAPSPLPAPLWRELLLTIGRLLTRLPGFSWAAARDDAADAAAAPDAPLRRLIVHLDGLLAALRIELTEPHARRDEIAEVAGALLAELDAAAGPRGAGA